jgi:hypothetical protein
MQALLVRHVAGAGAGLALKARVMYIIRATVLPVFLAGKAVFVPGTASRGLARKSDRD